MATDRLPDNPFAVLGVPLDADGRTVRHAFAEKLREARGSGNVDDVRKVQDAFTSIRDDQARLHMRHLFENEARVAPLLEEVSAALGENQLERAMRLLRQIVAIIPDFEPALWKLAQVAEAQGDVDGAIIAFEKLSKIVPLNPQASFGLAQAYVARAARATGIGLGKEYFLEKALSAVSGARDLGEDAMSCLQLESEILHQLDRKQEVRERQSRFLDGLVQIGGAHAPVIGFLLHCLAEDGKNEEFERTLQGILRRAPEEPHGRIVFCGVLEGISRSLLGLSPALGVRCAELALQWFSGHAFADGSEQAGQAAILQERLRQLIEKESRVAPIFLQVEEALKLSDFARARILLGQLLEADPRSVQALNILSDVEKALGNEDAALEALEKVIELTPGSPSASFSMAVALAKRGSPENREAPHRKRIWLEKALESLDRAHKLGTDEASCVHLGSCVREWLGRRADERRILAEFVNTRLSALDDVGLDVVSRLLHCQADEGLDDDFQTTLDRVKALLPGSHEKRQHIGGVLLEIGQGLSQSSLRFAVLCGNLATECRPNDLQVEGIVKNWRIAWRDQQELAQHPPERKSWNIFRVVLLLLFISSMVKACTSSFRDRRTGTDSWPRSNVPAVGWPREPNLRPARAVPPGRPIESRSPGVRPAMPGAEANPGPSRHASPIGSPDGGFRGTGSGRSPTGPGR